MDPSDSPEEVLKLWFDLPNKNDEDDALVREQLGPHFQRTRKGEYDDWTDSDHGRPVLIILFDQVPRPLYRDQPEQYAYDERARDLAREFDENGFPDSVSPEETYFAALPYFHAEYLSRQNKTAPVITHVARHIDQLVYMPDQADR